MLLARLSRNDSAALDLLLGRYWALVVDYVIRVTGSPDVADDVAQRTFCQLWDRRQSWRLGGSLRALLCRVARHVPRQPREGERQR